jgi:hypothetical protein
VVAGVFWVVVVGFAGVLVVVVGVLVVAGVVGVVCVVGVDAAVDVVVVFDAVGLLEFEPQPPSRMASVIVAIVARPGGLWLFIGACQ